MKYIEKKKMAKPEKDHDDHSDYGSEHNDDDQNADDDEENDATEAKELKEYRSYNRSKVYVLFDASSGNIIFDYGKIDSEDYKEEIECEVHRPDEDEATASKIAGMLASATGADNNYKRKVTLTDMLIKEEINEKDGRPKIKIAAFVIGPILPLLDSKQ